jgi:purine nucleosidase
MSFALNRRLFLGSSAALMANTAIAARGASPGRHPLARVIIDNDFAGDPDGLFQLAHHVLCQSLQIPLIVGSHLPAKYGMNASAAAAVAKAHSLLKVMNREDRHILLNGAETPIASRTAWKPSPATAAIVREAMREDTNEPLVYAAGGGLTELALAWLAEPRIGRRIKLIWIGGREHPGLAYPPPGPDEIEYNFAIDPLAAQIIFNDSDIEIWQVPRDAYRQMLFTQAEIEDLAATGPLGRFLKQELDDMAAMVASIPDFPAMPDTEAYVLGDSPLVTLTALLTPFQPDPASSRYTLKPTPRLTRDGSYGKASRGRLMRVYTSIDAQLTFRDMKSKFKSFSNALSQD